MKNKILTSIARLTAVAMLVSSVFNFVPVNAASVTSVSDTLDTLVASVSATHSLSMTLPGSGITTGNTLTVTYTGFATDAAGTPTVTCGAGTATAAFATNVLTLTGGATACSGSLTVTPFTITNPTAGSWPVTIAGTALITGGFAIAIVDSDFVTVTATVTPSITFDLDTYTAANTTTESSQPYAVSLGVIAPGAVSSSGDSDTANAIEKIGLDLATNATGGAVVTVKSTNGANGLVSTSVSADKIPAVSSVTLAAGTPGYGICVNYVEAGASDPVGTFEAAGGTAFGGALSATSTTGSPGTTTSATCTDTVHTLTTGLDGSAQNILDTSSAPVAAARALVLVKAAISATTIAHDDYTDTLTFVATGTF